MAEETPEQRAQRIQAFRDAVERQQKESRQAQRRENGFLKNFYNDNARIADSLKEKSTGLMYSAVGFSDEETLVDKIGLLAPVVGVPAAIGIRAAAVPFSTVAGVTKLAAKILKRSF